MDDRPPRDCVFCRILAGEAPGHIVAANDLAVALLDIHPLHRGHCLVIPRRHVPWWHDMDEDESAAVFDLARRTSARLMEVFAPDFVAMYARGRRIPHTHVFLVPTSGGDPVDRHFNALEGWQEGAADLAALRDPDALGATARLLRGDG
jgi:histidine triad (HIT) family protein